MTALRRLQKKPDPLTLLVVGRKEYTCEFGSFPTFQVVLVNLDVDCQPVTIQIGGDYRSGRQTRWRIVARDASGRELPQKPNWSEVGGGFMHWDTLEHGESWSTQLSLGDYVSIVEPGSYTLEILFHDHLNITDFDKTDGLVLCKSLPLTLTVAPVEVKVTGEARKAVRQWIGSLPTGGAIKILGGCYEKEVYDFIPPESPCGKLLKARWKAVPDLIDAALDSQLPPVRRAQVLAVLASITSQNDPREEPAMLGSYEFRTSGWMSIGGTILSKTGPETFQGGAIDVKALAKFAERWRAWKQKGNLKIIDEEPNLTKRQPVGGAKSVRKNP